MKLTFDLPDNISQRVIDGFCARHGYQEQLPVPGQMGQYIPNPDTKLEFVRKGVINFLKDSVREFEAKSAAKAALD